MNTELPLKVVVIKSIAGLGIYTVLTLNKATNEYEAFFRVPWTDEDGKVVESQIRLFYGTANVIMMKDTFISEEQYKDLQVVEYKKKAIDDLVEQLKVIK